MGYGSPIVCEAVHGWLIMRAHAFRYGQKAKGFYIIPWGKREVLEHKGNLTEYFAKTTLTVK